jgi:hypothetical protein
MTFIMLVLNYYSHVKTRSLMTFIMLGDMHSL